MIKGSSTRKADHPIDDLFLDRWSPRAMSGEEIPEDYWVYRMLKKQLFFGMGGYG